MSPILFNSVFEEALRKTCNTLCGAKIGGNISMLAFADIVALLTGKKEEIIKLAEMFI